MRQTVMLESYLQSFFQLFNANVLHHQVEGEPLLELSGGWTMRKRRTFLG